MDTRTLVNAAMVLAGLGSDIAGLIEDVWYDATDEDGLTAREAMDSLYEVSSIMGQLSRSKALADSPVGVVFCTAIAGAASAVAVALRTHIESNDANT